MNDKVFLPIMSIVSLEFHLVARCMAKAVSNCVIFVTNLPCSLAKWLKTGSLFRVTLSPNKKFEIIYPNFTLGSAADDHLPDNYADNYTGSNNTTNEPPVNRCNRWLDGKCA